MKCAACGREMPAGSAFCPGCGTQLAGAAAAPAAPVAPAAPRVATAARLQPASRGASQPAEETLWAGSYSPKAMIGWIVGAALLSIAAVIVAAIVQATAGVWTAIVVGLLIVWAVVGLAALYQKLSVRYQLTTFRLFHEKGILSRTRDRIEVIDIDDVVLSQGLIDRMLNVGTIRILASDESLREQGEAKPGLGKLEMIGIDNPRHVADLIDNTRRGERERRAIFMENV